MARGKGIPHDLAQYVIEAATGYREGFWDLLSKGATFNSTGRRRTKPGRALIADNRNELAGAEIGWRVPRTVDSWRGVSGLGRSRLCSGSMERTICKSTSNFRMAFGNWNCVWPLILTSIVHR
jgi:hypothetical protein